MVTVTATPATAAAVDAPIHIRTPSIPQHHLEIGPTLSAGLPCLP